MARWSTVSWLVVGLMATGPTTAFAQSAASGDFRGMVAVAEGKIHLECAGVGGPAVILISGYRNNAEVWTVEPGPELEPVFAGVAGFTRVCAYDRPGTILAADHLSRSDPVAMPRTADAVVAELHDLLQTSRIPGPHVLAAHSLGGLFARLYAATYPGDVAGIVLVDAWQEDLPEILGPDGWSAYVDVAGPPPPGLAFYTELESIDFGAASQTLHEAAQAAPLPPLPIIVISRARPVQLPPDVPAEFSPEAFEAAWREGQARLAALLPDAKHVVATESDHYVQIAQPALVVDAIRAVVEAVRDRATWRD
ncbi:MAG: alpha/beta hydrolase [Bauldia litoralis]|uniref:alpha/beta fold hydrolase n=1 Tax=Bauldia litoralis TaxID=665467 RepID=UPI003299D9AE